MTAAEVTTLATRRWEPEEYVTARELGQILRVSERTVNRLVREGLPSETWGLRARRFRPSAAEAWLRTRGAA